MYIHIYVYIYVYILDSLSHKTFNINSLHLVVYLIPPLIGGNLRRMSYNLYINPY